MGKRILKTVLVLIASAIVGLVIPLFGQWYTQQTGLLPLGLYFIAIFGGLGVMVTSILKIWGAIK